MHVSMQALCMHPSNPLLELRLHMPVMSSSPPSGLAEHLQLLQTSCIGPKCAFLQPPTPTVSWPQFCLVGPGRSSLSRLPSSHQDSDPVGSRPPPSLFSRSNILGFFSSPQHTGCAYYLLRGVVRFPSLTALQATRPGATAAIPTLRSAPARRPCPRC